MLESIKLGSSGESVEAWQYFLLGLGLFKGEVDGVFTPDTDLATRKFQKRAGLDSDGWVGTDTYAAALHQGFDPLNYEEPEFGDTTNPAWPTCPMGVSPLSTGDKHELFGLIKFEPAGVVSNPEAIRITNGWEKNIVQVEIPQLRGVSGAVKARRFPFHTLIATQVQGLFTAWEDHGYKELILSYAGSWVPRFVRGSRTTLSSHAWGTAFDINAAWNGYGRRPALVGQQGSVRELVDIAVECGFFWGGWFPNRVDGMHFEIANIL
jgi:hypothetical protein